MRGITSLLFFLGIIICFTACTISIGDNEYNNLSSEQRNHFKPVPAEGVTNFTGNDSLNLTIYEINSLDIKKFAKNSKYTWIHLWRPWCGADYCENINAPKNLAAKKDAQYFLVAETYGLHDIKLAVERTGYDKPIYVLSNSYYTTGHDIFGAKRILSKVWEDLCNNRKLPKVDEPDDYVFNDTLLVYTGSNMTEKRLDSIISLYPGTH